MFSGSRADVQQGRDGGLRAHAPGRSDLPVSRQSARGSASFAAEFDFLLQFEPSGELELRAAHCHFFH